MGITIGEAIVKLSGDSSGLSKGLDAGKAQLDQAARRVGESAGRQLGESTKRGLAGMVGGIVDTFGKVGLAALGAKALATGVQGLTNSFIGGNAAFEDYTVAFGVLLKSQDKAKARMAELAKFGAQTPFELDELVRADRILIAFGLDTEQTTKRFGVSGAQIRTTVGDIASGVKTSYEEVANIFGRLSAGASGEAISRMQELGITTRKEMASWGISFTKAGEMTTVPDKAIAILQKHLGDRFKGMMDQSSKTWNGMKSNVADFMAGARRTLGQASFDTVLKPRLQKLLALLGQDSVQKALESWGKRIAVGVGFIFSAFDKGVSLVQRVGKVLLGVFKLLSGAKFDDVYQSLRPLIALLGVERFYALGTAIERVVGVVGTFGRYLGDVATTGYIFNAQLGKLPKVLQPVAQALGGAVATVKGLAKAFADLVKGRVDFGTFWQRVATLVRQKGSIIWDAFADIGKKVWDYLFAKDDATGQTRAGDLVTRAKGWLETKAREVFSAANGLKLDLWAFLFGGATSNGSQQDSQAKQFLDDHKGALTTAAKLAFGPLGVIASLLLPFLFGKNEDGTSKAETFLKEVKGWFTTDKATEIFNQGKALVSDLWGFLFGKTEYKDDVPTWVDGILGPLATGLKTGLAKLPSLIGDIGDLLFGKTIYTRYGKQRVNGLVDTFTAWIGDALSKIRWNEALGNLFAADAKILELGPRLAGWLGQKIAETSDDDAKAIGAAAVNLIAKGIGLVRDIAIKIVLLPQNISFEIDQTGDLQQTLGEKLGQMIAGAMLASFKVDLGDKDGKAAADALQKGDWQATLMWAGGKLGLNIGKGIYKGMIAGLGAEVGDDLWVALVASMTRGMSPLAQGAVLGALGLNYDEIKRVLELNKGLADKAAKGSLSGFAIGPTTKGAMIPAGKQQNPLAEQFARMFDPETLNVQGLGEKIGVSLTGGIVRGIASGQGAIAAAIEAVIDPKIKASQVETVDAVRRALNPYRTQAAGV